MSRAASRDAAFSEFAAAVAPRLFRSALLMCGDWHLAEDLVQTTLGKIYVAWPRVERADAPEAYARGTLTKTFLSYKRVRRNAETPTMDVGDLARVDPGAGADQGARLELFAALRTLEPVDRAIVVLRYWEDRSVTETARDVKLSEGAVRTRASRALARLRTELSGDSSDSRTASS
jgi:RNA polymerase sigma-70 factor (sigma-E family)